MFWKKISLLAAVVFTITGCNVHKNETDTSINLENLSPALSNKSIVQKEEMLNLLLKYLAVESGSQYTSGSYPMTDGQREMARLLKADAEALGATATLTEWGYVYVTVPSNIEAQVPSIGISCHLDYTPEAPCVGIKPSVIKYQGGDIELADGSVISPSNPDGEDLPSLIGKTLIHSDGTTILGGDDKNGCAITMSVLKTIMSPGFKHGQVQFVWAPNEDIGMAAEKIDTTLFNPDILFDVDGHGGNEVAVSNFTARGLNVVFTGHEAHASEAKRQKLGDALAAASTFIASTPIKYRPESTEGREGYIHHWNLTHDKNHLTDTVTSRIRYFDRKEGEIFDKIITDALAKVRSDFPNVNVEVIWDGIQYENVAYTMHPASLTVISRAAARLGQKLGFYDERAGTTAAMFTAKGLKGGMNIFSGQHNCHKLHEYSCLEEMMDSYLLLLHTIDEVSILEQ